MLIRLEILERFIKRLYTLKETLLNADGQTEYGQSSST